VYIDSHAHYDFEAFDTDREELFTIFPAYGIDAIVNAGESVMSSYRSLKLARQYDYVYASAGVHPHNVDKMTDADLDTIRKLAADERCVAVGEIGFDYHYNHSTPANQRRWFERQLEVAKELDKPVMIHSREAVRDTLEVLRKYGINKGVIHCFTDDQEAAEAYAAMGLYIGIGGVITFPSAGQVVKAVQSVGVSRILLETDCPYLAPVPYRGQRNDSRKIENICAKLAEILRTEHDEVANITNYNTLQLFRISI